jgi:tartrate-resistant acid phosphatase type 5
MHFLRVFVTTATLPPSIAGMIPLHRRSCSGQRPWGRPILALLLILALVLPLQILGQNAAPQPGAGSLNFLVISDWGAKGSTSQVAVARQMARTAESQKASFVLTCGDNYHGSGIASADSPRWKTEFEDVYAAPSLMIPWYPSLGNHDHRGKVQAEIDYSNRSTRWKLPARYYSHTEGIDDLNKALFVHLDTSPFVAAYHKKGSAYRVQGLDPKAQLRWLESTLSQSRARWKIVLGHHPIYSSAPGHGDTKELIAEVLPVLQKHGVEMYFCGHDHVLEYLVDGGINFFVCGGGSSHRTVKQRADVRFCAASTGFLSVTLKAAEAEARFVDEKGTKLYVTRIPAP